KSGAKLAGVGSRDRLKEAPMSADMDFCLPGAQSCIMWAYPVPIQALENYFSKKERMSIKKTQQLAYSGAWATASIISKFIEEHSEYKAFPLIPNGKYRPRGDNPDEHRSQMMFPDFSLRYGAVAAGLGRIGWSGNLVTKEYGGSLYLGGVLTTAPLDPDPMVQENPCNGCKICTKACTTGYIPKDEIEEYQPVMIGGMKEEYSKRGIFARCGIGCAGWTGLSKDGTWSTWTPDHICLIDKPMEKSKDPDYIPNLMNQLFVDENTPKNIRDFNEKIRHSFGTVAESENVGLRPLEHTNPRCGNCNFICVKMLTSSGKIYIDEKGKEYVKKLDETGKEIVYYPPTEKEFFTEEDWELIDGIRKLKTSDIKNSLSKMNKVFSKYLV
ncbi:MAG: epoxyqueuosine reductase, partial [Deltaproteobacteria bacterium]|nr:epoxyqueuosine reductase [Deltaproteobacteria bacterium]